VSEPIRILRVIARLNMGGPALHVSYLSHGLAARGYRTTLVSGTVGADEGSMAFAAEERDVDVVAVPELQREISPLHDPVAIAKLVRLLREIRPHILHTHTAKAGTVARTAALLAGRARPPIVVHTFHGHVLRGYFGPAKTRAFLEAERLLARRTTRLVAVGPQVRDELVELGVAPADRFSVIRLGIDLRERVSSSDAHREGLRQALGLSPKQFVVGWIGRMTAIKRVPDVLAAFASLRGRGVDAALVLVGDGPDRAQAERLAATLGVAADTRFVGYQRDVGPYYGAIDALLLPSANEGTPVAAIEALAAARPVVATRVGGVPDVVTDGKDGLLFDVGDVEGMAEALERLARDAELRRRFGDAGRADVPARYAVDRLVDDTDRLYRELLADARLPLPATDGGAGTQ
jgi:glycosyltransferase involved in cell wall biosynthesis